MASHQKQYPKDAIVIMSMMKELGISDYEPRVVNQLLEFATRYVSCCLDEARAYANHSKKKAMDVEDVKLAVMMQLDKVFSSPPPRDLLLEVARTKNNVALPQVKPHCGIRLPPDRYCFSACNYRLKTNASKKAAMVGAKGVNYSGSAAPKKPGVGSVTVKRPQSMSLGAGVTGGGQASKTISPGLSFTTAGLSEASFTLGGTNKLMGTSKPIITTSSASSVDSSMTIKTEIEDLPMKKKKKADEEMEISL